MPQETEQPHKATSGPCLVLSPSAGAGDTVSILHCTWELQNSCSQCHRFWYKALSSYTGKEKHWEGGHRVWGKDPQSSSITAEEESTLGTVSMPSPGTHKTGCLSGELLPQFPSWYGPPRSSASGTHGFRRQLSSYENFHSPFLSSNQVHRIRGRDLPDLSPPSHPQAQPTCRCSLEVLSAPLLVEVSIHHYIQPEWEPELDKHSRVSQGTSEPGKSSVSSSACACPDARGQAGCGILQRGVCRHGQGWGDPSHNHHPGSPGSTQDKQP